LIDDDGVARLDPSPQSKADICDYESSALNTWLYTDDDLGTTSTGMERDVYGMSLTIYEASSYHPRSMPNLTFV